MTIARRATAGLVALIAALVTAVVLPDVAGADPATPVAYPAASSATRVQGRFFDTCTAPALTALGAWRGTSPYVGVNIYFGGRNRGCTQPNLTASWVRSAASAGWSLIPTYFGDQPFCVFGSKPYRYAATGAAARGSTDGTDAGLGAVCGVHTHLMPPGGGLPATYDPTISVHDSSVGPPDPSPRS